MNFKGKIAVITGGSNGIGKKIAQEFKSNDVRVAIIDKEDNAVECDLFYKGDISEENTLVSFSTQVLKEFGKIDYLINNACLSKKGLWSNCSYQDFNYVLKVGIAAPYTLTRLFMEHFNPDAAIVNISSTRAKMSQPDTESYSAAKGGISALTHAMAISLSGKVRVNSISPGWINSSEKNENFNKYDYQQHPVKRIGTVTDIANLVLFLCSPRSSFINGENITIDGGMSRLMIYHDDFGWKYKE
jgi:NAD(P)-dependent dehydrogenase (short-subunit alcohol dehydrogenase family)